MAKEIRYTAQWKLALGFVIWAAITGGFGYFSVKELYEDYCFTHHAVPVTGKVVQKYFTVTHGKHTTYTFHVSYNYMAGSVDGFCQQTVLRGTYDLLSEGGSIPVMYLPDDPAKVRVNLVAEERSKHFDTGILCTVAGLFLLGGGFVITRICLTNATWQRLGREGLMTQGVVKEIGVDYVGKQRTPRWFLNLEYNDATGSSFQGKSCYLTNEQLMTWRPGAQIEVCYDRNKPRLFTIDVNSGRGDASDAGGGPSRRETS